MTDPESTTERDTAESSDEPKVAADYESAQAELRDIFQEAEQVQRDLLSMAAKLDAAAPQGAEALRQVAGNVLPLLQRLICACGAGFESVDEALDLEAEEAEEPLLDEEEAVEFARTLTANIVLLKQFETTATEQERDGIAATMALNQEMLERVAELADLEPAELAKQLADVSEADEAN
jgi:hypothetical protein